MILYDIVKFSLICGDIPAALAYWMIYISVYFRVCVSHQNFVARGFLLPKKTLKVPSGEASRYFKGFLIAVMT
jgi:hypothetical protein